MRLAGRLIAACILLCAPATAGTLSLDKPEGTIRVATFNASLARKGAGVLIDDIARRDGQVMAVAEILQRVRPDILLINEIDYDPQQLALGALVDLIAADQFAAMRPGTILINCARGGIVNEAACAAALHEGHLRAYGCDVFSEEPAGPDNPILTAPNTVLTPHSAAWSPQSMRRMAMIGIQNILDCFDGKLRPEMVFNAKELNL